MNATATQILAELADAAAREWAPGCNAAVRIAEDPAHAVELLSAGKSGACAAVFFYVEDAPDGEEFAEDTRLAAQIRVGIVQHPGLRTRDGQAVPGVLARVDSFRAWLAGRSFGGLLDGVFTYKGMRPIPSGNGSMLNGYALTWQALYAYETEG